MRENLAILLAMSELPLADARNRLSGLVAEVEQTHDRVTITKHGHPAAVLISPDDLRRSRRPSTSCRTRVLSPRFGSLRPSRPGAGTPRVRKWPVCWRNGAGGDGRRVSERYELLLYGPARRAIEERLPLVVTTAVWEFFNGDCATSLAGWESRSFESWLATTRHAAVPTG